jgi:hypothetical protein
VRPTRQSQHDADADNDCTHDDEQFPQIGHMIIVANEGESLPGGSMGDPAPPGMTVSEGSWRVLAEASLPGTLPNHLYKSLFARRTVSSHPSVEMKAARGSG